MGHVFRAHEAERYEEWVRSERGRLALSSEQGLIDRIWSPTRLQSVLDVGCGSGVFTKWFLDRGHQVTGIDPSPAMLELAGKRLPPRVQLDRGNAEHLPYDNDSFDMVSLITTLEFADDPAAAIAEACRVAKRHVIIGALNRYSVGTLGIRVRRLWSRTVYRYARFSSVFELERLVRRAMNGRVPVVWRTCLPLPLWMGGWVGFLDRVGWLQRQPFGHFIAMRVDLVYPMRTVQDPIFADLAQRIGRASSQSTCYRSPGRGRRPERDFRENPSAGGCEAVSRHAASVTGSLEKARRI